MLYPLKISKDGEVESFKLIHVPQVANIIRKTNFFKSNCSLVIIDFLFRHGYASSNLSFFTFTNSMYLKVHASASNTTNMDKGSIIQFFCEFQSILFQFASLKFLTGLVANLTAKKILCFMVYWTHNFYCLIKINDLKRARQSYWLTRIAILH